MHLLYLHGFNSSPFSHKAQVTARWMAENHPEIAVVCPEISPYPAVAGREILQASEQFDWGDTLVVGSSMGGFYATWLADKFGCKAVLINPAVQPWRGREYLLGEQKNYHSGKTYLFRQEDVDSFQDYGVDQLSRPKKIWVLLQTGDEVLDYRLAEDFYADCRLTVESGGDHSFQQFERYLPEIIRFWKD